MAETGRIFVVDHDRQAVIRWENWRQWRFGTHCPEHVGLRSIEDRSGTHVQRPAYRAVGCFACNGRGWIYGPPAPNGEGHPKEPCPCCPPPVEDADEIAA